MNADSEDGDNPICVDRVPESSSVVSPEWSVIATVLDRFFLLLFVVVSMLMIFSIAAYDS